MTDMIDLHSHILPGIDDGAADLRVSLDMARAFVADGVTTVACTPHILPGVYNNTGEQIRSAVTSLQQALDENAIPLRLVTGADVHVTPNFAGGLREGRLLSLADSRYVLVEPPHHVLPPRLDELFFSLQAAGYVPILTHPERLTWVRSNYELIQQLVARGVWMQITAGSLTGAFGRNSLYWSEKMLQEGCVHVIATDAHDCVRRPPILSAARDRAEALVGSIEAQNLVLTRPRGILVDASPNDLPVPLAPRTSAAGPGEDLDGPTNERTSPAAAASAADGPRAGDGRGGLARRLWRLVER